MVIGNGLMASAFKDYRDDDHVLIFASGVSDSCTTDEWLYLREEILLRKTIEGNKDKQIIYFTSFIDPLKKRYVDHKRRMEDIIKFSNIDYTILRLPQVVGSRGNPNNLFNYLIYNIKNDKTLNIYSNTYRSLIDADDVKKIVDVIIPLKNTFVVFPYIEKLLVEDIVYLISRVLNKRVLINSIDSKGFDFPERTPFIDKILKQLNITEKGYTERLIHKYI